MKNDTLHVKKIRGKHDSSKTPPEIYNIVISRGYVDVCIDITDNVFFKEWPEKSYCNPPFSLKAPFVKKAVAEYRKGKKVLLYLPLDPTTEWFRLLYENNAQVFILMKRWHNRWPMALYLLANFDKPSAIFIKDISDLEKFL